MSRFRVRAISGAEANLEGLVDLHCQALPPHMRESDPHQYFSLALDAHSHINIVATDNEGSFVGYLLGLPLCEIHEELSPWDPELRSDPDRLYLETIQILPSCRGLDLSLRLIEKVCLEAEKRQIHKLAMHARTVNGWSRKLHRIFASVRTFRRIENWFDSGEPFDYMEATTKLRITEGPREHSLGKGVPPLRLNR